jgi:hypothetical protein
VGADKKKWAAIFGAKREDNSDKFEILRDTLVSGGMPIRKRRLGKTEVRIQTGQEQRNAEIEIDLEEVEAKD